MNKTHSSLTTFTERGCRQDETYANVGGVGTTRRIGEGTNPMTCSSPLLCNPVLTGDFAERVTPLSNAGLHSANRFLAYSHRAWAQQCHTVIHPLLCQQSFPEFGRGICIVLNDCTVVTTPAAGDGGI